MNFPRMFKGRTNCPLKCNNEEPHEDTQEHLLTCKMNVHTGTDLLNIEQAFDNIAKQEEIAQAICKIIRGQYPTHHITSCWGWEPIVVLWGGLLHSSPTPTPPGPQAGVGTHSCAMGGFAP